MGDTSRPFAVIHGGDEKSAWTELIEDHTTDYTCATFGELFADFAYQLRNGEHSQLMHRLNACAVLYGAVPLPPDEGKEKTVTETRKRYTLPRWARAHYIEQTGSLGAIELWDTDCNRPYRLPDPEVDEPIEAPADMPLCKQCAATVPPSSVDEGNPTDG